MYCQHCGREIAENSEICIYCGKDLKTTPVPGKMYRHEITRLKPPLEEKNPKVAALLGFLLGWLLLGPVGYIYLGQWNWFWITFIVQIFAYPLTLFIAYPLLPVVFAIHQYQMATELNQMIVPKQAENKREGSAGIEGAGAGVD